VPAERKEYAMIRLKSLSIILLLTLALTACGGELLPLPQPTAIILHPDAAAVPTPTAFKLPSSTPPSSANEATPEATAIKIPPVSTDMLPKPADQILKKGTAEVTTAQVIQLPTDPPQYVVHITGDTPTPCHKLRVSVDVSKNDNRVVMESYSVFDPKVICLQMVQPFEVTVPLGKLPVNDYTVWLNGQQVGEIKASG
jgi:hypothetical protein